MTATDPLTAVNPLPEEAAARLALDAAEREMLDALVATVALAPDIPAPRRPMPRLRRSRAAIGALAVAIPVIAVLAVLPLGRHSRHGPVPATTNTVRPRTGASPQVLLQLPGWRVARADEESTMSGELDFARVGKGGIPLPTQASDPTLIWYPASEENGYLQDRGSEASIKTTATLLGATAQLFQYKPSLEPHPTFTAIWVMGPRALMYEARARDMHAFEVQIGHLHVVSDATWITAMPKNTVTPAQRATTIRTMLRGVVLPPGFNVRQIPGATLVRNRYELGTAVTGTVTCEWFARWGRARQSGDRAEVNRAVSAMARSKHWPILRQMGTQGGWTEILERFVAAMPGGHTARLLAEVNTGLGCSAQWNVKLPGLTAPNGLVPAASGS
jgi:hypothetical protein